MGLQVPDDLLYSKDHEWIRVDGNKGIVGITDYAQGELGDIVFVEIEIEPEEEREKAEPFGTIEAVKTVSDLMMPVSGKLLKVNEELQSAPELINKDPYENGWIIEIEINNPEELKELLPAEEYKKLIGA